MKVGRKLPDYAGQSPHLIQKLPLAGLLPFRIGIQEQVLHLAQVLLLRVLVDFAHQADDLRLLEALRDAPVLALHVRQKLVIALESQGQLLQHGRDRFGGIFEQLTIGIREVVPVRTPTHVRLFSGKQAIATAGNVRSQVLEYAYRDQEQVVGGAEDQVLERAVARVGETAPGAHVIA